MDLATFSSSDIYLLCALVILLALSFIVSGSETALQAIIKSQGIGQREESHRFSTATIRLTQEPNILAYSLLVLGNLINIATTLITFHLISSTIIFSSTALEITIKLLAIGFLLLIVCIFIPKTIAAHNPTKFIGLTSPLMWQLTKIVHPLSWLLAKVGGHIISEKSAAHENVSIEQLQSAIEATSEESSDDDKKIVTSIVTFIGREVSNIMKPRVDITAIDSSLNFKEVIEIISTTNFSRIPVYENSFDQISGILFAKDLLPYIDETEDFKWHKLIREPFFIPESKKINDLLEDFQTQRRHLAIVVDEYGGTLGIVTLEDILEEIVGEITDETDTTSDFYKVIAPGIYLFDGSTHIEEFGEVLNIEEEILEEKRGNADTLAGLMMELRGEFFGIGEEIGFEKLILRAEEVERYRITKILVTKIDD